MQFFNCDDTVTSLEGALKKLGRPTTYVPVGFAATKDRVNDRKTDPTCFVGKMVAMRFPKYAPPHDKERFWIGRVEGKTYNFKLSMYMQKLPIKRMSKLSCYHALFYRYD